MINFREKTWHQGTRSYRFWALLTPANRRAIELFEAGNRDGALAGYHAERMRLYDFERKGIVPHQIIRAANATLGEMMLSLDESGDAPDTWPFHVFKPTPPCVVRYLKNPRSGFNPWTDQGIKDCPHTPNCMRRD